MISSITFRSRLEVGGYFYGLRHRFERQHLGDSGWIDQVHSFSSDQDDLVSVPASGFISSADRETPWCTEDHSVRSGWSVHFAFLEAGSYSLRDDIAFHDGLSLAVRLLE